MLSTSSTVVNPTINTTNVDSNSNSTLAVSSDAMNAAAPPSIDGALIGGVIVGIAVIMLIIALVLWILHRRNAKKPAKQGAVDLNSVEFEQPRPPPSEGPSNIYDAAFLDSKNTHAYQYENASELREPTKDRYDDASALNQYQSGSLTAGNLYH
jgi:heme/copper-type cytochrome/quinol oxidase subunit 1